MELRVGYSRPSLRSFSVTRLARAFKKGDKVDISTIYNCNSAEQRVENEIESQSFDGIGILRSMTDLCCGEEDFLCYVSDGAGDDTQAHPGEDVGIVPLTRMEGPPIRQRDGVKRAPAGENAPTLQDISVVIHIPGTDSGVFGTATSVSV